MAVTKCERHHSTSVDLRKRLHNHRDRPVNACPGVRTRLQRLSPIRISALWTTEVLENVLSNLDVKDLIAARGVCKKWQRTVDGSLSLQQQLFLCPAKPVQRWTCDEETLALRPFIEGEQSIHGDDWVRRQGVCKPAILNPAFLRRDFDCIVGKRPIRSRFAEAKRLTLTRRPDLRVKAAIILDKMFLTQPPTTEVHIQLVAAPRQAFRSWYRPDPVARRLIVKRRRGVRWSDVKNRIRDQLNSKGRTLVEHRGGLKLLLRKTIVWACGVVFCNEEEKQAVESGKEDRPAKYF